MIFLVLTVLEGLRELPRIVRVRGFLTLLMVVVIMEQLVGKIIMGIYMVRILLGLVIRISESSVL